jgi:hypothetical protein
MSLLLTCLTEIALATQQSETDSLSSTGLSQNFKRASLHGAIGETSNLYLMPEGIYFHPLYNDVNGGTDKQLTGSIKLGTLLNLYDYSLESTVFWRLLTPSFKSEFNAPHLDRPVGRYADWLEWKSALAKVITIYDHPFKLQLSLGWNHVGDKGGKAVHQWIHKVTHNSIEELEYINQPEGRFWSKGIEIAFLDHIYGLTHFSLDQSIAVGLESGRQMTETYARYNINSIVRKSWWELGLELRFVRQHKSEFYSEIRPYRFEASAGTMLYGFFSPTIKYISPFLKGDDVGQTYFDFLHFNYEF